MVNEINWIKELKKVKEFQKITCDNYSKLDNEELCEKHDIYLDKIKELRKELTMLNKRVDKIKEHSHALNIEIQFMARRIIYNGQKEKLKNVK